MIVFVDVDDTLVRWAGTKKIPMTGTIERVKELHAKGHTLYLWSSGGEIYAKEVAEGLGIEDLFTAFLPKPGVMIDDQEVADWRGFIHEYPGGGQSKK